MFLCVQNMQKLKVFESLVELKCIFDGTTSKAYNSISKTKLKKSFKMIVLNAMSYLFLNARYLLQAQDWRRI